VRRILTLAVVIGLAAPPAASAVSLTDLVELTRAGLSDDVIVALIQTDRTIYDLDATTVLDLKRSGVSDAVVKALLANGRDAAPPGQNAEAPLVAPTLVIIGADPPPETSITVSPGYFWVPAFGHGRRARGRRHVEPQPFMRDAGFGRFINDGFRGETDTRSRPER
jgi:hypothetical protein